MFNYSKIVEILFVRLDCVIDMLKMSVQMLLKSAAKLLGAAELSPDRSLLITAETTATTGSNYHNKRNHTEDTGF